MAMGQQPHPMRATARNAGAHMVAFTTNNIAAPTTASVVDDGGVVSSTVGFTSPGVFVLTLNDHWTRVRAAATLEDATATNIAKVTGHVEGSAATNTITIQTENAGAAADTTGQVVSVLMYLSR